MKPTGQIELPLETGLVFSFIYGLGDGVLQVSFRVTDVKDAEDFINIFQTFYQLTGRLPLSNGLLVIPDGDPPPGEDRVNMKSLYKMFQHTNSHRLYLHHF